jgi:hypothetical protein
VYAPSFLAKELTDLRPNDPYWRVVSVWDDIWNIPNNLHQKQNFFNTQPEKFNDFDKFWYIRGDNPMRQMYNKGFLSGVYNAKAAAGYDAVMRNPFGSSQFVYMDFGVHVDDAFDELNLTGPRWIDHSKLTDAIRFSGDQGVVMGQTSRMKPQNHQCWSKPSAIWQCHSFLGGYYFGTPIGMLKYSMRYMKTIDAMDAKGMYIGREEYAIPFVAAGYPGTILGAKMYHLSPENENLLRPYASAQVRSFGYIGFHMKLFFSAFGGDTARLELVDPVNEYCSKHITTFQAIDGKA